MKGSMIKIPHIVGIFVWKQPNNLGKIYYFRNPLIPAIYKNFSGIFLHFYEEIGGIF